MQPCGSVQGLHASQCKQDTSFISRTKVQHLNLSAYVRGGWIQLNLLSVLDTPNKSQMTWLRLVDDDKILHDIAIGKRMSAVHPDEEDFRHELRDQDYPDVEDGNEYPEATFGATGRPTRSKSLSSLTRGCADIRPRFGGICFATIVLYSEHPPPLLHSKRIGTKFTRRPKVKADKSSNASISPS
jgi:hypothetical protein